ncbi:MAG: NAD(P)H-dependent oxidoreductase subunit E [bacterium]|jgi:NADH-quinone oxidoreductase subunit E
MAVAVTKIPAELKSKFDELESRGKYPKRLSMLVPALHIAQEHYGWISGDAVAAVAEFLGVPENYVKGCASFYSMFFMDKPGKYVIQVCHNATCQLLGAEDIIAHLEEKLGVETGKTTPDGKFTVLAVECLAACGRGPVIQINNREYHENMNIRKVDELLETLK